MCSRFPCVQTRSVFALWLGGSCQLTSLFHTAAIITVSIWTGWWLRHVDPSLFMNEAQCGLERCSEYGFNSTPGRLNVDPAEAGSEIDVDDGTAGSVKVMLHPIYFFIPERCIWPGWHSQIWIRSLFSLPSREINPPSWWWKHAYCWGG